MPSVCAVQGRTEAREYTAGEAGDWVFSRVERLEVVILDFV